ncbi:hypothetical protein MFRU_058g00230 [Monilinia fructicola]|uniref:Uncharacterized protein n=1 Tax=Monilinia fructicola TaxID=38448 RepID=A0A5M9JNS1_MONFR|nr:hypothetical protein EYC84_000503 [Monilinia fructicola]KAG4025440.1 hypothetical protein MFRU_058g00230 [Monilinia fructicola]
MPSFTPSNYSADDIESQISQQASSQNSYRPSNVERSVKDLGSQHPSHHPRFSNQHRTNQIPSPNALERQNPSNQPRPQNTYDPYQNYCKNNDIESQRSRNDAPISQPYPSDIFKGYSNEDKKMWQCLPIDSSEDLEGGMSGCYFWNPDDVDICHNCGGQKAKKGCSWFGALKQMFWS